MCVFIKVLRRYSDSSNFENVEALCIEEGEGRFSYLVRHLRTLMLLEHLRKVE